jgi:dTMP kinase
MLVMAARYEHVNKVVIPAIENGSWVICDRYVDSTASYQAEDSGLSIEDIYEIHDRLIRGDKSGYDKFGLMPDITFFMDIPPDIAVARAIARGDINKFDKRNIAFHQKVYDRYQRIIDLYKNRFISIDCVGKDSAKIHNEVVTQLFH